MKVLGKPAETCPRILVACKIRGQVSRRPGTNPQVVENQCVTLHLLIVRKLRKGAGTFGRAGFRKGFIYWMLRFTARRVGERGVRVENKEKEPERYARESTGSDTNVSFGMKTRGSTGTDFQILHVTKIWKSVPVGTAPPGPACPTQPHTLCPPPAMFASIKKPSKNNPHHLFHSFRPGFLFSSVVYIRYTPSSKRNPHSKNKRRSPGQKVG